MTAYSGLLPVDRWVAFVNLILLTSWLPLAPRFPVARWFVLVHLVALTLPWLLSRARTLGPMTAALRESYPLLWTIALWSVFGLRRDLTPEIHHDAIVSGWDAALFGGHHNLSWVAAMPWLPLSEAFQASYFSYYLMMATIPIVLWLARTPARRREVILRIAVGYLGCYLIYAFFPVVGPRELLPNYSGEISHGLFYQINAAIRAGGDSLGTAFPSSHTVGALTFAWVAWRLAPGRIAWAWTAAAGAIALATVYTQNHFPVDTVAGIVVGVALQAFVVPAVAAERVRSETTEPDRFTISPNLPEAA